MNLNRKILSREKLMKEEILLAPESGVRHDIDLKTGRNEVMALRP
jgi:hypothetical protein